MSEQSIPRGIEILVKKASVDLAFRTLFMEHRDKSADGIGLKLEPAEAMMLKAVPAEQLATIISNARVEPQQRTAFMGYAAAVMLAALTVSVANGCGGALESAGARSDLPSSTTTTTMRRIHQGHTRGSMADLPPRTPKNAPAANNETFLADKGD